ncbi:hypothetical protein Y032_0411g958 [Ancylostoma ceylanicum]|uniref:Uncharacterized protein n=1 Tax=Ancylostoma ceylanicum TaxID=53326 RepID=A0A016X2D6_9BILA|nr:hypothetical protein Y032_0411g958 [Ancylostoma ceylanicum]
MYNDAGNVFVGSDHFTSAMPSRNSSTKSRGCMNGIARCVKFCVYSTHLSMSLISCEIESEDEFSRGLRISEES